MDMTVNFWYRVPDLNRCSMVDLPAVMLVPLSGFEPESPR